ncbi:MAG: PEGA domain-containing protein [Candidatus Methanoglobus sp.]
MNSIYLSSFRINNSSITTCGLPEDLREMQPGYYSLIVLGVNDYGNPILKLLVPFVVLNGTSSSNKPTVSDVVSGKDLSIRFREEFNASFAVLVKNVQYDASVRMDLTKKLSESFNVNLSYGAEKLEEIKIMDKNVNFYAPGKMVRAVFNNSEKFQNISTKNLETGSYILYIFVFGDNLEPRYFGCLSVNILAKETILINSSPPEADVYINGSYVGKTNLTVQLDPGTYEVSCSTTKVGSFRRLAGALRLQPHLPVQKPSSFIPCLSLRHGLCLCTHLNPYRIPSHTSGI